MILDQIDLFQIKHFLIHILKIIKGIRDAGSTADFRILFKILEF